MNAHAQSIATGPVAIALVPPVGRFNLRVAPADLAAAARAFGVALPDRIGRGARADGRSAWCLGPDEWLLHAPEAETDDIIAAFAAIRADVPHSLTVISDREVAVVVEGARAEELLTVGCPVDLRRLEPGMAKRTLFDTVQVVILRDAPERFRLEVWRSFFPHVHELLQIGNAELASGF